MARRRLLTVFELAAVLAVLFAVLAILDHATAVGSAEWAPALFVGALVAVMITGFALFLAALVAGGTVLQLVLRDAAHRGRGGRAGQRRVAPRPTGPVTLYEEPPDPFEEFGVPRYAAREAEGATA